MSLALVINHEGLAIAGAIFVPHFGGYLNGAYLAKANSSWYHGLAGGDGVDQAAMDDVVLPLYGLLYGSIGYASYRVFLESQRCAATKYEGTKLGLCALTSYAVGHVVLHHTWTGMFFAKHDLGAVSRSSRRETAIIGLDLDLTRLISAVAQSLILISIIDLMAIGNTYLFYTLDEVAGYCMVPYTLWMLYVGYMNYVFWDKNGANQPLTLMGNSA